MESGLNLSCESIDIDAFLEGVFDDPFPELSFEGLPDDFWVSQCDSVPRHEGNWWDIPVVVQSQSSVVPLVPEEPCELLFGYCPPDCCIHHKIEEAVPDPPSKRHAHEPLTTIQVTQEPRRSQRLKGKPRRVWRK